MYLYKTLELKFVRAEALHVCLSKLDTIDKRLVLNCLSYYKNLIS